MGLLDGIISQVTGGNDQASLAGENAQHAGLVQNLIGMFGSQEGGGIAGLLGHLKNGGLAEAVSSWIGTGANQPVTGAEVGAAVPPNILDQLAAKVGLDRTQVSNGLAQVLPGLVDKLTPDGTLPSAEGLQKTLGGLVNLFAKKTV